MYWLGMGHRSFSFQGERYADEGTGLRPTGAMPGNSRSRAQLSGGEDSCGGHWAGGGVVESGPARWGTGFGEPAVGQVVAVLLVLTALADTVGRGVLERSRLGRLGDEVDRDVLGDLASSSDRLAAGLEVAYDEALLRRDLEDRPLDQVELLVPPNDLEVLRIDGSAVWLGEPRHVQMVHVEP